ncbi:MAG: NADH-quinone oxidoreductase subunit M [Planctomycetota bacterium]|nr:NADH-quinone oxidoreductase subunit M [Planctomycetota bacterium]
MSLLHVLTFAPVVLGLLIAAMGRGRAFTVALIGSLVHLALTAYTLWSFDWSKPGAMQLEGGLPWIQALGITLNVGVDSVAMLLIALTSLLGPICVLASKTAIVDRQRTFYAWLTVLSGAMVGVFAARDIIFFYICFEFTLIPMFFLIHLFGSINRTYAAIKFFLYTFTGSIITLAGLVYVAYQHTLTSGSWTFDIAALEMTARSLPATSQAWVLLALMLGFAVKVPLFPFHTWLPLAHTEAPTAGSVILAGVLLKLGTYGLYRFALPFTPAAVLEFAPLIAGVCVVGIIYGGLICWVQTDVKKLVAYSSVAHLGFCVLGLIALNQTGVTGSILYMINHGLSTGALFLLIGFMYERYHTRSMREVGGLAAKMPIWATFMVFFTMASVGLPGLNGFISEFLCLMGAFQASSAWGSAGLAEGAKGAWGSTGLIAGATPGQMGPWLAAIAGTGMIIAAIYLLYMLGKVVFGPLKEPAGHDAHHAGGHHDDKAHGEHHGALPADLTAREITALVPLAVLCIALGVYPKPVTDALREPVAQTVKAVQDARPLVPRTAPAKTTETATGGASQNQISVTEAAR